MVKSAAKHHLDEAPEVAAVEHEPEFHLEPVAEEEGEAEAGEDDSKLIATVATVGVVGIGAALIEAALLPGVILGVAAVAFPQLAPKIGSVLGPMFKSTVRGLYRAGQKTREFVAETQEHVQDIVAEVDAEVKADASAKESVTGTGAPLQ